MLQHILVNFLVKQKVLDKCPPWYSKVEIKKHYVSKEGNEKSVSLASEYDNNLTILFCKSSLFKVVIPAEPHTSIA